MLDSLNYRMKMAEKKVSKCKKYININYLILQKKKNEVMVQCYSMLA